MLCLLNRFCWVEVGAHLIAGDPRTAFRRYWRGRRAVTVQVEGIPVLTTYHRPSDVARALGAACAVVGIRGLAVMVPPPHLAQRWLKLSPGVRRAVERADALLAARRPFSRMGDHFVIELEKR